MRSTRQTPDIQLPAPGHGRRNGPPEDWRRSRGYPYQPVLIGDLRAKGHVLEVHCNTCAHFVELDPKTLPLDDNLPVPEARSYFKCSRCGSRSIKTRPQVYKETNAQIRQAAQEAQRVDLERGEKVTAPETVPHDRGSPPASSPS
jgi:DNA-directed RNA polymerase subunit RPC12/RpoP